MSATLVQRSRGAVDTVGHAIGDVLHAGAALAQNVAEATADRASDAGHLVGSAGHLVGAVAERAATVASDAGRSAGHRVASTAGDLRDAALDRTGRSRRRRRITVRRTILMVGIAATLGLLVLAARRARTPWAEQANAELDANDPRRDADAGAAARQYASAN